MQTNVIAILGLLKSNNVYGEGLLLVLVLLLLHLANVRWSIGMLFSNKIISLETCIRYILAAHM